MRAGRGPSSTTTSQCTRRMLSSGGGFPLQNDLPGFFRQTMGAAHHQPGKPKWTQAEPFLTSKISQDQARGSSYQWPNEGAAASFPHHLPDPDSPVHRAPAQHCYTMIWAMQGYPIKNQCPGTARPSAIIILYSLLDAKLHKIIH